MPTKWVVTTPTDRIELDENQQGQTTFTVTNPSARVDRVVFDVVAGDGADASWFSVDEPQRRVPASGSVSYLMKTAIPTTAKAGAYSVQGRVYSADSAPEEDSVLSSRLAVEIKAKAVAAKKKFPWWIVVVAVLVVIVLGVIGFLIFGGSSAVAEVTVPDLTHESQAQATTNLAVFGLTVGTITHKQDATPDSVLYQSVAGGAKAPKGSPVNLVITTSLAAPTPTAPAAGAAIPHTAVAAPTTPVPSTAPTAGASATPTATPTGATSTSVGLLRWTDSDPFVTRWQVTIQQQVCVLNPYNVPKVTPCPYLAQTVIRVDTPSFTPILIAGPTPQGLPNLVQVSDPPQFQWQVAAVDDFGNVGPESAWTPFSVS